MEEIDVDISRVDSAKNITSVSHLESKASQASRIEGTHFHVKSVDIDDTDLVMVDNATTLMAKSEDVDMSRVLELKEKIKSGGLNFSMHELARVLTRG